MEPSSLKEEISSEKNKKSVGKLLDTIKKYKYPIGIPLVAGTLYGGYKLKKYWDKKKQQQAQQQSLQPNINLQR